MSSNYIGMERFIFAEAYNLFLKYKDMDNTDYCWNELFKEQESFVERYHGNVMARDMMYCITSQMKYKLNNIEEYDRENSSIVEFIRTKQKTG